MVSRRGIGEVVGSVSMLAITIAMLGGASYLALASINGAAAMVDGSAQQQRRSIGLLLSVVGSQVNGSGTYIWIYDYGWQSAPVDSVFFDAQRTSWSTSCVGDWAGSMCVVVLPRAVGGLVTIVLEGKSVEASV